MGGGSCTAAMLASSHPQNGAADEEHVKNMARGTLFCSGSSRSCSLATGNTSCMEPLFVIISRSGTTGGSGELTSAAISSNSGAYV